MLGERCVMSLGTMSDTTNTGMDARENLSLIEFSRVIDFPEPDTFTRGSVTCLGNFYLGCFMLFRVHGSEASSKLQNKGNKGN